MDLGNAVRFAAGAIGEPGRRTFFLEVATASAEHWFLAEKTQVAALALEAAALLKSAGLEGTGIGVDATLSPPTEVGFRIGDIGLVYTEADIAFTVVLMPIEADEHDEVQFTVTPALLDAMARVAAESVTSGRPICPKCGLAMDPDGHVCPTGNGDLRHHRP